MFSCLLNIGLYYFGFFQVMLAKQKKTDELFALKVLKKEVIVAKVLLPDFVAQLAFS